MHSIFWQKWPRREWVREELLRLDKNTKHLTSEPRKARLHSTISLRSCETIHLVTKLHNLHSFTYSRGMNSICSHAQGASDWRYSQRWWRWWWRWCVIRRNQNCHITLYTLQTLRSNCISIWWNSFECDAACVVYHEMVNYSKMLFNWHKWNFKAATIPTTSCAHSYST